MNKKSIVDLLKKDNLLKIGLILVVFLLVTYFRYRLLDEAGGDLTIFRMAVTDFIEGKNPYEYTVKSFEKDSDKDHGYAYFPTLLYIYTPLYKLHLFADIPLQRVWKSAVFLAEIGTAFILIKLFYKKDYISSLVAFTYWWINPFLIGRGSYVYTDPFGIFFIFLALYYLERDDMKAGLFYAVSFSFKSFPVILLPLFLIKSKHKLKFLLSGAFFALIISIPFLKSYEDFITYLRGSLFVHGSREPQGRPFIAMISILTNFPIFTLSLAQVYKYVSLILSSLSIIYIYFKSKVIDKYILSSISFGIFYLFTPVLTRTYMLWFIPIFIVGAYNMFSKNSDTLKGKRKVLYFMTLTAFYLFYAGYLLIWDQGIEITDSGLGF